ncbi:MAG: phenylalanine--tRNA ligase subunit beta [Gammaproteobacteria bacterium]|nr:phenylalanine--tRNA ligase subunit beta [Gammaproteobacteria bacterium]
MIISELWLRDLVRVDLDAQGIADCLTNAGLEVDGVERLAGPIDNLVVGRVLEVEKHPDADRLNLTKVDIGTEVLEIVCGAANVRVDLLVAVAKVGAKLPNGLKIKKAKVRGVPSVGMLCSASELGLEEESSGLIELDFDAKVGQRVDEYLKLDDSLIDIDLTPNRGDCLSVQGIARELKVLANGDYNPVSVSEVNAEIEDSIEVQLDARKNCPRYSARVIKGINQETQTPLWMQEKLRRSGVRPISPVVDITNYVMIELGQPMHAFDLAKLDQRIIVRLAKQGEKIKLLDESEVELDSETLVIADAKEPVAIAGVMGGLGSAIDDDTQDIVLEAAHFTRASASGKARRYGLHTESSHRFERGVDPQLPLTAMERATELVVQICGGHVGPVVEQCDEEVLAAKPAVSIRLDRLKSLLGMDLDTDEVDGILNRVSDSIERHDDTWTVTPPSYRFDIEYEADLVEEVARVKGYDNIPTAMPKIAPTSMTASESSITVRQVRSTLVARDFREAITYSFIDAKLQKVFCDEEPVLLANPLAENMAVMRTSLIPGLFEALKFNANRQHSRIRLFESGATYHKTKDGFSETQKLAAIVCGSRVPMQWATSGDPNVDFFDLKSDLLALLSLTGRENQFTLNDLEHKAYHPGQTAGISYKSKSEETELGVLARLHPSLEKEIGVGPVFVFELNLDLALAASLPAFESVSKYPSVKRDLSLLISNEISVADLMDGVRQSVGSKLVKVEMFDLYTGQGIKPGFKSVSMSLVLRNTDSTMTDEESEGLVSAALDHLAQEFGATLRS